MKKTEILKNIGLTGSEALVYLALLRLGSSLASRIAKECGLHRTNVYDSLDNLMKKGLASFVIKENRKYFQATNPEKLLNLLKRREEEVNSILPELKKYKNMNQEKVKAQIFTGKEGFKVVMEDLLKSNNKEWLMLGGSGKGAKLAPYYLPSLRKRIDKAKIKFKAIYANTSEAKEEAKEESKYPNRQIKIFPDKVKSITTIHICGDKVAIIPIVPNIEKDPVIFFIENQETAKSFEDYFNWIWKIAKP